MSAERKKSRRADPLLSEFDGLTDEERELKRQRNLIGTVETVFSHLNDPIRDPLMASEEVVRLNNDRLARLHIVEQIREQIRSGWTITDLLRYQDEHFEDPTHAFLTDEYPGLNVIGWKVFMALVDPLKHGTVIQRSSGVRATISKRS